MCRFVGGINASRLFGDNKTVSSTHKEIAKFGEIMIGVFVNAAALSHVYDYSSSFWTVRTISNLENCRSLLDASIRNNGRQWRYLSRPDLLESISMPNKFLIPG